MNYETHYVAPYNDLQVCIKYESVLSYLSTCVSAADEVLAVSHDGHARILGCEGPRLSAFYEVKLY